MDETTLYVQPCCADKVLPKALIQASYRMLTFYTRSDVTTERFYRAVAHLVGEQAVMVLTQPRLTIESAGLLHQCFERKWISRLILSTAEDQKPLVERYLSAYSAHILYASSPNVTYVSSHMVLFTSECALTLSGPLFDIVNNAALAAYHLAFYPSYSLVFAQQEWSNPLRNILFPDAMRHRRCMHNGKQRKGDVLLDRFLQLNFPPYAEDEEEITYTRP